MLGEGSQGESQAEINCHLVRARPTQASMKYGGRQFSGKSHKLALQLEENIGWKVGPGEDVEEAQIAR